MPDYCCIANCKHSQRNCSLRVVPSDPSLKALWIRNIRTENGPNFFVKLHHRVCDCHFTEDQFVTKTNSKKTTFKKLLRTAIPNNFSTFIMPTKTKLVKRISSRVKKNNSLKMGTNSSFTTTKKKVPVLIPKALAPKPLLLHSTSSLVSMTLDQRNSSTMQGNFMPVVSPNMLQASNKLLSGGPVLMPKSRMVVPSTTKSVPLVPKVQPPMGFLIPVKAVGNNLYEPTPLQQGLVLQNQVSVPLNVISTIPNNVTYSMEPSLSSMKSDCTTTVMNEDEVFLPVTDANEKLEEFDEDDIMPPLPELCRLCAEANTFGGDEMIAIFGEEGKARNIPDLIKMYIPIQISMDDKLPLKVCVSCVNAMNQCHEMILRCKRADVTLQRLLLRDEEREASPIQCTEDLYETFVNEAQDALYMHQIAEPTLHKDKIKLPLLTCSIGNCKQELRSRTALYKHYVDYHDKHACTTCWKIFSTTKKLQTHKLQIHAEWHLCDMCGVSVKGRSRLRLHMEKHIPSSERPFKCDVCDAGYSKSYMLLRHKTRHTERSVKCSKCSKTFYDDEDLKRHVQIHADKNSFKCKQCARTFTCKRYLASHIQRHHNTFWQYTCDVCDLNIKSLNKMKRHMQELHANIVDGANITSHYKVTSEFYCNTCARYFANKYLLSDHSYKCHTKSEHLTTTTTTTTFQCNNCHKTFKRATALLQHERNSHGVLAPKTFECDICKRIFTSKALIFVHMEYHLRKYEKPYACQYCTACFANACTLRDHVKIHLGEVPYECPYCPQKFPSQKTLSRHIKTHTKPHICKHCGKQFPLKYCLTIHERTHTNERPFQCKLCERKFKQKSEVEFHQLLHTNEKKFKCGICGFCDNKLKVLTAHVIAEHQNIDNVYSVVVKHDFS